MRLRGPLSTGCCAAALIALVATSAGRAESRLVSGPAQAALLRARGVDLGYNLDRDEALAAFKAAIAADPDHPAAYRLAAATLWLDLLFQQGAISAEDYLGQAVSELARQPPPPEVDRAFRALMRQAVERAEAQRRLRPNQPDAHYQIGAAHGFLATYAATVEGRVLGSLGAARRAFSEHERVLRLDPRRRDAGLIVGMYRYGVSNLPIALRLLAGLAGLGGGRERGLRLVEDAAAAPSEVQANARFSLIVLYKREGRYDAALQVIADLQRAYPRNRLLWLEAGSTALRAGRVQEARRALDTGLAMLARDPRRRAFGEEARWQYQHGRALAAAGDLQAADRAFRSAVQHPAHDWLKGRVHVELGRLADRGGKRPQALSEYREAVRLCRAGGDEDCADEASALAKRPPR